ncbi:MAG: hypothetical protein HQK61_09085, partial [Desulfamplus sp.]|nr:hypothetical protein [Desulfamplus sp.]
MTQGRSSPKKQQYSRIIRGVLLLEQKIGIIYIFKFHRMMLAAVTGAKVYYASYLQIKRGDRGIAGAHLVNWKGFVALRAEAIYNSVRDV